MGIHIETCPGCSAPVLSPAPGEQWRCPYCGNRLARHATPPASSSPSSSLTPSSLTSSLLPTPVPALPRQPLPAVRAQPWRGGWQYWGWFFFAMHGQIGRRLFWAGVFYLFVIGILVARVGAWAAQQRSLLDSSWPVAIYSNCMLPPLFMLLIWAAVAIGVKRLRDRGRSGWWLLLLLLPLVGPLWAIVELGLLPSAVHGSLERKGYS